MCVGSKAEEEHKINGDLYILCLIQKLVMPLREGLHEGRGKKEYPLLHISC